MLLRPAYCYPQAAIVRTPSRQLFRRVPDDDDDRFADKQQHNEFSYSKDTCLSENILIVDSILRYPVFKKYFFKLYFFKILLLFVCRDLRGYVKIKSLVCIRIYFYGILNSFF